MRDRTRKLMATMCVFALFLGFSGGCKKYINSSDY